MGLFLEERSSALAVLKMHWSKTRKGKRALFTKFHGRAFIMVWEERPLVGTFHFGEEFLPI